MAIRSHPYVSSDPWGFSYGPQRLDCVLNNIAAVWVAHNSAVAPSAFMMSDMLQLQNKMFAQEAFSQRGMHISSGDQTRDKNNLHFCLLWVCGMQ